MDNILLILIILLLGSTLTTLYLNLKTKPKNENNEAEEIAKLNEEIVKLKDSLNTTINSSLNSMSTSFNSLSTGVTKDMTEALTKVDEKVGNFNQQVELLNKGQQDFTRVLSGVKKFGTLAEYSLEALIKDILSPSQFIANAKMRPDEDRTKVEFAVILQDGVLCPIDSHWPLDRYKAVDEAFLANDKSLLREERKKLVSAIKKKAADILKLYIAPPKTTDFAILYLPTEGLYSELTSYRDPDTKILLIEELRQKYKITLSGPNNLCALLQAFHMGFQTLKIQKHATQIYNDLKTISVRFEKHFLGINELNTHLTDALDVVQNFGRDARSIRNTLENIKDPDLIETATKKENVSSVDFKDKKNVS